MIKINVFYKESMGHYHPESYDEQTYEVKKGDTLYSILNNLGQENGIPKELVKKANDMTKKGEINKNIKPGDKISFELQDNNSAELTINGKTQIIKISKTDEAIDVTNNSIASFQSELLRNLENRNPEVIKAHENLEELLSGTIISDELPNGFNTEVMHLQKILYLPELRNNEEAIGLIKILNVLSLEYDITVKEAVEEISKVFDDKNIRMSDKYDVADFLRKHYFGFLVEPLGKGYISDSGKGVEVANELTKKYPKYNFENFMSVSDPEGGEVWTNNF